MNDGKRNVRDRSAQKRRTRRAILTAAVELMRRGETPTANRVAELADVSRRTVYHYFPTHEQLLTEAAMEPVRSDVERQLALADANDVSARLETLVAAGVQGCLDSEVQLRTLIRLTVERRLDEAQSGVPLAAPLRGGRRIEWIETTLAPIREELGPAAFERLVSALALVIGIEALLVLRDIRGLGRGEVETVSQWAARALLDASFARQNALIPRGEGTSNRLS